VEAGAEACAFVPAFETLFGDDNLMVFPAAFGGASTDLAGAFSVLLPPNKLNPPPAAGFFGASTEAASSFCAAAAGFVFALPNEKGDEVGLAFADLAAGAGAGEAVLPDTPTLGTASDAVFAAGFPPNKEKPEVDAFALSAFSSAA
jgi:hypothetical protein